MKDMCLPSCSLVITTYNWPAALNVVLQSVYQQSVAPQQVVIADDGSTEETIELINSWKVRNPNLLHCWQEDNGFRAARSRNNALARVTSDYVVIIDGDMVLEPRFIEDHVKFASVGSFVQGRRINLKPKESACLLDGQSWCWDTNWSRKAVKSSYKLKRIPWLAQMLGYRQYNAKDIRSCNMGFWMQDLLAVNGFDSEYVGWGREDSDLGYRLINYGLTKRHLRYAALALHVYHPEQSRMSLPANTARLQRAIQDKHYMFCHEGLSEFMLRHEP